MECTHCNTNVEGVDDRATGVICSECSPDLKRHVVYMNLPPDIIEKALADIRKKDQAKEDKRLNAKPRGWAFMNEFVDHDGRVYFKGKEQPTLKGTMEPSKIEKKKPTKKRKTKKERQKEIQKLAAELFDMKKKLTTKNLPNKDQKELQKEISVKQKLIHKLK